MSAFILLFRSCSDPCYYENIVDRLDGCLEVIIGNTDDDIQLTGALVDHLDIDIGMRQCGEDPSGSSSCGLHAASYDGDEC